MELEFQKLKFYKKVPLTWIIWIKKYRKELEFKKIKFLAIWYSNFTNSKYHVRMYSVYMLQVL